MLVFKTRIFIKIIALVSRLNLFLKMLFEPFVFRIVIIANEEDAKDDRKDGKLDPVENDENAQIRHNVFHHDNKLGHVPKNSEIEKGLDKHQSSTKYHGYLT